MKKDIGYARALGQAIIDSGNDEHVCDYLEIDREKLLKDSKDKQEIIEEADNALVLNNIRRGNFL